MSQEIETDGVNAFGVGSGEVVDQCEKF